MVDTAIIATGAANLASIQSALTRLGAACRVVLDPGSLGEPEAVVLPGVGSFGPAVDRLRANGLDIAIGELVATDVPVLAVCLGMQLLFDESAEAPGKRGLGLFPGGASAWSQGAVTPQMGWNEVRASGDADYLRDGAAYFANSYRVTVPPEGARAAVAEHGERFVAAFETGSVLACQFHPELSGDWGMELLGRWLESVKARRKT